MECFKSCIENGTKFHLSGFQDLKILVQILLSVILTKKITYRIHIYLRLMMYDGVPTQSMGSVLTWLYKLRNFAVCGLIQACNTLMLLQLHVVGLIKKYLGIFNPVPYSQGLEVLADQQCYYC